MALLIVYTRRAVRYYREVPIIIIWLVHDEACTQSPLRLYTHPTFCPRVSFHQNREYDHNQNIHKRAFQGHIVMVTQAQVFSSIRGKLDKRRGDIPRKAEITKMMKQLYEPSLDGPRYFYAQDENDLPIARIPTVINGKTSYCAIAPTNVLDAKDWLYQRKPKDYVGKVWPPKRVEVLLGKPAATEYCISCWNDQGPCDCSYKAWSEEVRTFVISNVALRSSSGKGYGGFARARIRPETPVGELTGHVLPRKAERSAEEDQYHSSIIIGEFNSKYADRLSDHPSAWIDCTNVGSFARFYNHSCEPNARIVEARCGMGHRIIYFETLGEAIEKDDEITVDYGEKWFTDPTQPCFCGTSSCKNPPPEKTKVTPYKGKMMASTAPTAPRKQPSNNKRKKFVIEESDEDVDEDFDVERNKKKLKKQK